MATADPHRNGMPFAPASNTPPPSASIFQQQSQHSASSPLDPLLHNPSSTSTTAPAPAGASSSQPYQMHTQADPHSLSPPRGILPTAADFGYLYTPQTVANANAAAAAAATPAHFPYSPSVDLELHRGRTGFASSLPGSRSNSTTGRIHPYSRESSLAPRSRDSSRDATMRTGTASTPSTPPKSGRAGVKRRQKYSRTRTGCLCCRQRRIKCDEERPVCHRCVIAKKQCQYPDDAGGLSSRQSSREDTDRASRRRSPSTGEDDPVPYSNPFNLAIPAYGSKGGIVDPADYNWDSSFVGNYAGQTSTPLLDNPAPAPMASPPPSTFFAGEQVSDEVASIQQKYAAAGGAPMLATPNFLLPWFPTQEERSLILHYCANAADLMMAIPSGLNPMLAINLPLALNSPRGMDFASDALRVALLGIGAIHQAFLLARSGVSTTQTTAMFQYASNLRDMGKELVRRAASEAAGAQSDAALGAATALGTIDIFFGGGNWTENFNLAKEMVAYRGGPAAMLKASTSKQLAEGVTVSPARLMLEILAIYEVFGCLATGEEPALLSDKYESWWFETGHTTYEEHSVEKQFGMSRVMVHLFFRLTSLLARAAKFPTSLTESDDIRPPGEATSDDQPPTPTTTWLNSFIKPDSTDPLLIEARKLNADVDAWIESLKLSTLEHERVQVGNRAYAYAMKILLLRRVFKYPRDDSRVQGAASEVLRHCSTSTAILGMSIDLTWPAIIAGCCVDGDARQWLLTLLEGFKSQCCFDIETAGRIIAESWRRVDAHEPKDDWKEVCEDFGLNVLLC